VTQSPSLLALPCQRQPVTQSPSLLALPCQRQPVTQSPSLLALPCASASQCSPRVAHRPKGTRGLKAPPRCHEASGMQPGSPFVCTMSNGPLIENSPNSRSFVPAVVLPPQLPRSRSTVASSRWHCHHNCLAHAPPLHPAAGTAWLHCSTDISMRIAQVLRHKHHLAPVPCAHSAYCTYSGRLNSLNKYCRSSVWCCKSCGMGLHIGGALKLVARLHLLAVTSLRKKSAEGGQ
jgi:hypothetical protein